MRCTRTYLFCMLIGNVVHYGSWFIVILHPVEIVVWWFTFPLVDCGCQVGMMLQFAGRKLWFLEPLSLGNIC
jgi:hypothetical protein